MANITAPDTDTFYNQFFQSTDVKLIIQVGANDGIQNDPLRKYFIKPGNYAAILIEPIPFYVNKLCDLYKDRADIRIIHRACGNRDEPLTLYYMPPDVADKMNGNGPFNNWGHGQGSFDKETVIYWIMQNKFRGENYEINIPYFIQSITSIDIPVMRVKDISINSAITNNTLLVIDVQGLELEVISGINWDNAPQYIVFEDDMEKGIPVIELLKSKHYEYICGDSDKVFGRI